MSRYDEFKTAAADSPARRKDETQNCVRSAFAVLRPFFRKLETLRFPEAMASALEEGLKRSRSAASKNDFQLPGWIQTLEIKKISGSLKVKGDSLKTEFVRALIRNNFSATLAAREIGYAEGCASAQGKRLLGDDAVQGLIGQILSENANKAIADLREMLELATEIIRDRELKPSERLAAMERVSKLLGLDKDGSKIQIANVMGSPFAPLTGTPERTVVEFVDLSGDVQHETEPQKQLEVSFNE